jgi:hypothetical protein
MRAHDPYVRLLLDRILAGHGELLQEFPLRPRATRRVDGVFVPGERRDGRDPARGDGAHRGSLRRS